MGLREKAQQGAQATLGKIATVQASGALVQGGDVDGLSVLIVDDESDHILRTKKALKPLEAQGVRLLDYPVREITTSNQPLFSQIAHQIVGSDDDIGLVLLDYNLLKSVDGAGMVLRDLVVSFAESLPPEQYFYVDMLSGVGGFLGGKHELPNDGLIISKDIPDAGLHGTVLARLAGLKTRREMDAQVREVADIELLEDKTALEQFTYLTASHLRGHVGRSVMGEEGYMLKPLGKRLGENDVTCSNHSEVMTDDYACDGEKVGYAFTAVTKILAFAMTGFEVKSEGKFGYSVLLRRGDRVLETGLATLETDLVTEVTVRGEQAALRAVTEQLTSNAGVLNQVEQGVYALNKRITGRSRDEAYHLEQTGNTVRIRSTYADAFVPNA